MSEQRPIQPNQDKERQAMPLVAAQLVGNAAHRPGPPEANDGLVSKVELVAPPVFGKAGTRDVTKVTTGLADRSGTGARASGDEPLSTTITS